MDKDKNPKFSGIVGDNKGYINLKFHLAAISTSGLTGDRKFDGGQTGGPVLPFGVSRFG